MRITEYDLWFADHAGRSQNLRGILEQVDTADWKEVYEGKLFPRWKRDLDRYRRLLERAEREQLRICRLGDPEYPYRLAEIYDPPYLLFCKGELPPADSRTCAVVGARKATPYGRRMAFEIGKTLGEQGVWVVSGLALGADGQAHRGCLAGGGATLAVLGSGADVCTPSSHRRLMEEILAQGGGVLSEQMPGTPGLPEHYPRRNRIISGISECVVVVEADERSGTSITANLALEQGRDLYALPGNITSVMSRGTNRLIREGAMPLISVDSILEEMGVSPEKEERSQDRLPRMGQDEALIWRVLQRTGGAGTDELCALTGKPPGEVAGLITVMEMKGWVLRIGGKIMIAK